MLIQGKVGILDAGSLQCRNHAVEFCDVGHGPDANAVHFAAGNLIVAHVDLAVTAAAQSRRQAFRIRRVGKCAGLHE